ncbi:MAG: hypothetical protein M1820_010373 [Bogoriella megaspora]|nr:MAG: hypothetical protein M1820_010373 [Bogoriella megaspora]
MGSSGSKLRLRRRSRQNITQGVSVEKDAKSESWTDEPLSLREWIGDFHAISPKPSEDEASSAITTLLDGIYPQPHFKTYNFEYRSDPPAIFIEIDPALAVELQQGGEIEFLGVVTGRKATQKVWMAKSKV